MPPSIPKQARTRALLAALLAAARSAAAQQLLHAAKVLQHSLEVGGGGALLVAGRARRRAQPQRRRAVLVHARGALAALAALQELQVEGGRHILHLHRLAALVRHLLLGGLGVARFPGLCRCQRRR